MADKKSLLDPLVLARLSSLSLKARYVIEGVMSGLHRSPTRGFSQEFVQHREYVSGDDLRYIDWKVLGRSDKYFIKQYKEETNLRAYVVLDTSKSMSFSSAAAISKLEYASVLAASIAYMVIKQGDSAGLAVFDKDLKTHLPPSADRSYLKTIVEKLENVQPGEKSDFTSSFGMLSEILHKRSIIIIISDLLGDPDSVINAIKYFRYKKNEVVVFQILDKGELDLSLNGSIRFEDIETNERLVTYPEIIKDEYEKLMKVFLETYKVGFRKSDIDYCFATTDMPFDFVLGNYLNRQLSFQ
ncbi:MAG: DUF58 domain-containing protein [bacterium]